MDRSLSLTKIEGKDWGEPSFPSWVVTECHRLRHVPLEQFTPENLRLMIGQLISLEYLVPMALNLLKANPLLECVHYPGDLLEAVKGVPASYWQQYPEQEAIFHVALNKANGQAS